MKDWESKSNKPLFIPEELNTTTALLLMLSLHYSYEKKFVLEFGALADQHRDILGSLGARTGSIRNLKGAVSLWEYASNALPTDVLHKVESLAYRWGLRAEWGPGVVLDSLVIMAMTGDRHQYFGSNYQERGWYPLPSTLVGPVFPSLDTDLEIHLMDKWDYLDEPWEVGEQRVIDAVRTQLTSQRDRIMKSASGSGWDTPNRQNSQDLVSHVEWTYRRISRKESWKTIALDVGYSLRTVRDTVTKMLDLLGIGPPFADEIVPSSPPGRPRKFQ